MINWPLRMLLAEKKITQSELVAETAKALCVKRGTVRSVFTGHKRSRPIEEYVAKRLGASRTDLFSSRKHGSILPRTR